MCVIMHELGRTKSKKIQLGHSDGYSMLVYTELFTRTIYKLLDLQHSVNIDSIANPPHLPTLTLHKPRRLCWERQPHWKLPSSIIWYYSNNKRVFSTKLVHFPFVQVTALCVRCLFYAPSVAFLKRTNMDIIIRQNNAPLNSIDFLRWN